MLEEQPTRALTLERPRPLRCIGQLVAGAVLEVVSFGMLAVAVAFAVGRDGVTAYPETALGVLGLWLVGYMLWIRDLVRPYRATGHELEVFWNIGGMLLVLPVALPYLPDYRWWMAAIAVAAWAVFAVPPAIWGFLARRARRLQAQGWSAESPPTLQELRPWITGWLFAVLAFVAVVAAALHA